MPCARSRGANGVKANMGTRVTLEIKPGEILRFPQRCVNCGEPAAAALNLRKRRERITRELQAPLCTDCRRDLERLSGEEERWLRLAWFFGALALLITLTIVMLLLPGSLAFVPRLLLGLLLAGGAGAFVTQFFRQRSEHYALPEKRAVRDAVRLGDFSADMATLEFVDSDTARQFIDLNHDRIMETEEV